MEQTNIIMSIIVIFMGTVTGLYFSYRLKIREESLRELTQVLREMALLIRHRALPVKDLFEELSRYDFIGSVNNAIGADFRGNWLTVTDELTELAESERSIIKSVGLSLGTSDVQGQLSMLEVNAQLLAKHGDEAHEQYNKKGKLYRSCGLLAGLFLAVLII
jgi:stage III sporulation protein AB